MAYSMEVIRRHSSTAHVSLQSYEHRFRQLILPTFFGHDQVLQLTDTKITKTCSDTTSELDVTSFVPESRYIKELYVLHWDELCGYLGSKFSGSSIDPENIAQAAFIKFAELEDNEKISNPRGFLYAAARNCAFDQFRREKVRLAHKEGVKHVYKQEIDDHLSPENILSRRQHVRLMANSVKKLPKIQRTVLLLHRLDKLTYTQIANKMGLSETTIRRNVAKAVEYIRRDMRRADGS